MGFIPIYEELLLYQILGPELREFCACDVCVLTAAVINLQACLLAKD